MPTARLSAQGSGYFLFIFIFFPPYLISLTIGASRLMEEQMDLPRLLFGIGFQIFYSDASNVYVLSLEYVENVRGYLQLQPQIHITLRTHLGIVCQQFG